MKAGAGYGLPHHPLAACSTTYPQPTLRHHDHASRVHRIGMVRDQITHGGHFLRDRHADKTNDAWVRQAAYKYQLAKVLVFGNQDPLLLNCEGD